MSGGVDSSVAAALLKRAGVDELRSSSRFANARVFDVSGVFMKLNNFSSEAERRARKVAKILKIPFYVFNFEKEFKKKIVDCFLKEYKAGRTPNPCVVCNKEIKFGLLLEKALRLNADFVATGHYAKIKKIEYRKQKIEYKLLKGRDKNKDQSYFLWQLNQKQLKHVLFPVGDYTKGDVRKLAKKFKLPVFEAPESMEVCFIQTTINDFLKKYLKEKTGNIVDKENKVLGRHKGLWFYTIGQRKGIGLSGGPYYVLSKDFEKNLLIVTKNKRDLFKKELITKEVNWISGKEPRLRQCFDGQAKLPLKIKAKIRYHHNPASATIYKIQDTRYKILFDQPQPAITPGQSVVFYSGQELLGGGVIR